MLELFLQSDLKNRIRAVSRIEKMISRRGMGRVGDSENARNDLQSRDQNSFFLSIIGTVLYVLYVLYVQYPCCIFPP